MVDMNDLEDVSTASSETAPNPELRLSDILSSTNSAADPSAPTDVPDSVASDTTPQNLNVNVEDPGFDENEVLLYDTQL